MSSILVATLLALLGSPPIVAEPPSCLYEAYGCVYYIWDLEDGLGEALVTCDGGGTFYSYSGRFGDCPY
jgi:hypothetical protein